MRGSSLPLPTPAWLLELATRFSAFPRSPARLKPGASLHYSNADLVFATWSRSDGSAVISGAFSTAA